MALKLPLSDLPGTGGKSFSIELAGDVFRLEFRYNDREDRWYLAVFDEDDTALIRSVKVVVETPLLFRLVDPRRPRGELYAVDRGSGEEPNGETLGAGVDVVFVDYFEAMGEDDLSAALATATSSSSGSSAVITP